MSHPSAMHFWQLVQQGVTYRACLILREIQNVLPKSLPILRRQGLYNSTAHLSWLMACCTSSNKSALYRWFYRRARRNKQMIMILLRCNNPDRLQAGLFLCGDKQIMKDGGAIAVMIYTATVKPQEISQATASQEDRAECLHTLKKPTRFC